MTLDKNVTNLIRMIAIQKFTKTKFTTIDLSQTKEQCEPWRVRRMTLIRHVNQSCTKGHVGEVYRTADENMLARRSILCCKYTL